MVNISMRHGTSGDSASAYGFWGSLLGLVFHRYREGYRFSKLACDLVEKHLHREPGLILVRLGFVSGLTQPIETAIDSSRSEHYAPRLRREAPVCGCYGLILSITYRLLRNDPLDVVWRESEMALEFARKARYDDAAAIFVSQQRFIATMQGRTASFLHLQRCAVRRGSIRGRTHQ